MIMIYDRKLFILAFLISLLNLYCTSPKKPDIEWNFTKNEITGNRSSGSEKLNVDIYLDATTSMKGFVSKSTTDYSRLLDDIEAACQNVWRNTDIQYYKFGRSVQPASRNEFTAGKVAPEVYSDPTLSTQTNFAEAVKKTNAKRVSILITDLFYNNNDVNLVVGAIKEYCFQKGVEIGVIGLNSAFDGVVADLQPPVRVKGVRPVYVMVFGDKQNISLLFNTLKNKPYIKPNQFLLITNRPTEKYEVDVVKNRTSKTINKQSLKEKWKDYGTVFNFRMKEDAREALFNISLNVSTNPYTSSFSERNLKALVYKKTGDSKDSVAADNELTIQNIKLSGDTLKAEARLINNGEAGNYSYLVYITFDNTVPLTMPKWVKDASTETYGQGMNESKTLNLEKLLTDISTNHITYTQPKLAKFYINVEKR